MTKTETSQMNDDRMDHQSRQHIFFPFLRLQKKRAELTLKV